MAYHNVRSDSKVDFLILSRKVSSYLRSMMKFVALFLALSTLLLTHLALGAPSGSITAAAQLPVDAVVMVLVTSPMEAHVAVSYKRKVPRTTVRSDADRLVRQLGGVMALLTMDDVSVHPDRPNEFPINTACSFTVSGCSQLSGSAPNIKAYLVAFQQWNQLEVLFSIPKIENYRGVTAFKSPELDVKLTKEDDGYRYEAVIREHKKDLPSLPQNTLPAISSVTAPTSEQKQSDRSAVSARSTDAASDHQSGALAIMLTGGFALIILILVVVMLYRLNTPHK